MKRCPKCQTTFGDDKRFCQIDGTPLVEITEPVQTEDPFKTVVVGKQDLLPNIADDSMKPKIGNIESKEDDILQLPEEFDPMKTMVVSEPVKFDKPVATPPKNEPVAPNSVLPSPEIPKFDEPKLTPPTFGDLPKSEPKTDPVIDTKATQTYSDKPKVEPPIPNPFSDSSKQSSPFSTPMSEPSKPIESPTFESKPLPSESPKIDSPFSAPIASPFEPKPVSPAFKEPESPFSSPSPFDSPFAQKNEMSNQPVQNDSAWTPPPAPVQSWGEQGVGSNTPFQPPVAGSGGQNQTLAIVSLVLGILSIFCCGWFVPGIIAVVLGFMAKGKAETNPSEFGGRGLALGGIITGVISIIMGIIVVILYLLGFAASLGR